MVQELIKILESEYHNYEQLCVLAEEKKDVVIKGDIETLKNITASENELVGRNQKLEKSRTAIMEDIANVLGQDKESLTLTKLIELLNSQEKDRESLKDIQTRFRDKLDTLRKLNEKNGILIQQALSYVEYNVNVMQSYRALPSISYESSGGVRVSEGRNFFDTKR